jgi:hypothetical protein
MSGKIQTLQKDFAAACPPEAAIAPIPSAAAARK